MAASSTRLWRFCSSLWVFGLVISCNLPANRLSVLYARATGAFFTRLDDEMLHGLEQGWGLGWLRAGSSGSLYSV